MRLDLNYVKWTNCCWQLCSDQLPIHGPSWRQEMSPFTFWTAAGCPFEVDRKGQPRGEGPYVEFAHWELHILDVYYLKSFNCRANIVHTSRPFYCRTVLVSNGMKCKWLAAHCLSNQGLWGGHAVTSCDASSAGHRRMGFAMGSFSESQCPDEWANRATGQGRSVKQSPKEENRPMEERKRTLEGTNGAQWMKSKLPETYYPYCAKNCRKY